jgi:integrase
LSINTLKEYRRILASEVGGSPIGKLGAQDLRRADVKDLLERIARRAPVMANRTFQFVRAVLRWGVREEMLKRNPCEGLQRPRKEKSRDRVLSDHEIGALWHVLDSEEPDVAGVVKLLLLLGQRSKETIHMRSRDLDFGARTWTIPGEYRKGGRLHVVPLPSLAIAILEGLRSTDVDQEHVFRGVSAANAERDWWGSIRTRTMEAGAEHFTKHDLRRTCATGCARLGASPFIVSRILGHSVQPGVLQVTGIYDRFDRLPELASALNAWASYVQQIVSLGPGKATLRALVKR